MKGRRQKRRENVSREEAIGYTVQAMGRGLKAFEEDFLVAELAKLWRALAAGAALVGAALIFPGLQLAVGLLLASAAAVSVGATVHRTRKAKRDGK